MRETDKDGAGSPGKKLKSEFDNLSSAENYEFSQEAGKVLADLLGNGQNKGIAIQVQRQMESYSSPLPHPKHLAEYRKDCPDILERSLAMAERGQAAEIENSRRQLENERLALGNERLKLENQDLHDGRESRGLARGQLFGLVAFILALLILCGTCLKLALAGYEKTAISLFIGSGAVFWAVFNTISAFLYSAKDNPPPEK